MSPAAQIAARKDLERAGLARFKDVRVEKRTNALVRVEPAGWQLVGKHAPAQLGRGDIDHTHFQVWLEWVGKKRGYKACREWIVPGTNHPADCAWQVGTQWHVFEVVVTATGNLVHHLTECLVVSNAVASVTIVAAQKGVLKKLKTTIDAEPTLGPVLGRVRYESIAVFMKELWP